LPAKLNANDALAHAGEVAQWTLLMLGWLWLGEQGSRLGWSLASGVMAVALLAASGLIFCSPFTVSVTSGDLQGFGRPAI
jgi:hypothetical protein